MRWPRIVFSTYACRNARARNSRMTVFEDGLMKFMYKLRLRLQAARVIMWLTKLTVNIFECAPIDARELIANAQDRGKTCA